MIRSLTAGSIRTRARLGVALLVASAAFGWCAEHAQTASAASCGSTYTCMWVDSNFGRDQKDMAGDHNRFSTTLAAESQCQDGNWNDCASSLANNGTSCVAYYYWDIYYAGSVVGYGQGNYYSSIGSNSDQYSAMRFCTA